MTKKRVNKQSAQEVLDALNADFKRAEQPVEVTSPEGKKTLLTLRALTSIEEQSLQNSQTNKELLHEMTTELLEKVKDGKPIETDALTDIIAAKIPEVVEDSDDDAFQRLLKRVEKGIFDPEGITVEMLSTWNPEILEQLNDILDELALKNIKWVVKKVS